MNIKTYIGNLEVIDTKIVHVTRNSNLSIKIENLSIIIEFLNDKNEENKINREIISNTTLKIKCNNFNNSLGEGVLEPIEIGILDNKKMYLTFFVWTPNISLENRIVNYCLYLEY